MNILPVNTVYKLAVDLQYGNKSYCRSSTPELERLSPAGSMGVVGLF
jgi:hypothetical protein